MRKTAFISEPLRLKKGFSLVDVRHVACADLDFFRGKSKLPENVAHLVSLSHYSETEFSHMMQRVFYIGPFSSDELNERLSISAQVGAIRAKMLGVSKAMKHAGYDVSILTALPSTAYWGRDFSVTDEDINILVTPVVGGSIFRLVAMFRYAWFLIARTTRSDIVLFYNYFPEYILAALILKLLGRSYVLDIEDGPVSDFRSLRQLVNRAFYRIHVALRPAAYFSVSDQLTQLLHLPRSLTIHGVATPVFNPTDQRIGRSNAAPLIVLYGGTLIDDTGLTIFLDSLPLLAQQSSDSFEFILSGYFDQDRVDKHISSLNLPKHISVVFKPRMRLDEYKRILLTSGVALSLKLPQSVIGQTTFPSKLIEYGSWLIPIISTRCANVEEVLTDDMCFFLPRANAQSLVEQLTLVSRKPALARGRAEMAHQCIMKTISIESVGDRIARHFNEHL